MVLPFEPMTMTFKDLHYWVTIPKDSARDRAHVHMEGGTPWLELLLGISGAFRPKVLTCLMGVTGAGKTTLMDVLAGRKTGMARLGLLRHNFMVSDLPHGVCWSGKTVLVKLLAAC